MSDWVSRCLGMHATFPDHGEPPTADESLSLSLLSMHEPCNYVFVS